MRTANSIKNSISSFCVNLINILLGFIAQAYFIKILGAEYLGLNGLFSNILGMLSIFELGVGSAIVYNLYKPFAENNKEEIKSLMYFYKKSYNYVALSIFTVGIILIPFLTNFVGKTTVEINIYIVYLLFLSSTIVSYLNVYKRNLLYANQKNYIINIVHGIYLLLLNLFQLIFLYLTKNFYVYLLIKIICQLIENIILTLIANKLYPFIKDKNIKPLDKKKEKQIFSKVKALFFHKIGSIMVLGTDNIIISKFLGVVMVGFYSNYNVVIKAVTTLFSQIISSITSSIGNLIIEENHKKNFQIFKKIRFLNFWLSCFAATSILIIIQPFITLWIGKEYLLDINVVIILVFNYYQSSMRISYSTFKDSAGIWQEDKYVPLIESILNVVFSIILLKYFGLFGVFMGTTISGLALWCYSFPKFVYRNLFDRSYSNYAIETLGYMLLFICIACFTYQLSLIVTVKNIFLKIVVNSVICLIVPNLLMFLFFKKTDNYMYFRNLLKKIFKKILRKSNEVIK